MKTKSKKNILLIIGVVLLVIGSGPLIITMGLAALGFGDDPNPNPVIFGIMAGLTFWPSIILIGIGLYRNYKKSSSRNVSV
jgi:MFS superfamily sulfate permease-like transporter